MPMAVTGMVSEPRKRKSSSEANEKIQGNTQWIKLARRKRKPIGNEILRRCLYGMVSITLK